MADRKTKVTLSVQMQQYIDGMQKAAKATKDTSTEAEKLAHQREAFDAIGKTGIAMGALLATGIGVAVKKFADFDEAMSHVEAATHESAENMAELREAAIQAGASTVFSATESANAIEELAKAGISTADIIGGALAGSLDLAAAGGLGVARAAEISATALQQFKLEGDQAGHVADVLAAGAGKAMGSVEDLAQGLKFVGPIAASMGVSIEETTGTLALFAQQGIIGEQAGTSLRGMLSSLTSPSSQARKEIEALGIQLYDAEGNFMGLQNAAGQMSKAYSGMTGQARDASLGIIFGNQQITAATALYQAGAEGVQEWTAAVDETGYASKTAAMRLDNLKGDIEALGGAMDSALIETGSAANDSLRALVQALTSLVDMYNDLPEPVKGATLAIGGATAAIGLAGGGALIAVKKFAELKNTLALANISMGRVGISAGVAGLALGGLFAIVGTLAQAHAEARQRAQAYADTLENGSNRITEATRDMAVANLAAEKSWMWISRGSAYDAAEKLGISLDTITDAAMGNADALTELKDVIDAGSGSQEAAQRVADELGVSMLDVSNAATVVADAVRGEAGSIEEAIRVSEQKNRVTKESKDVTDSAADAYLNAAREVDGLNSQLDNLVGTLTEANSIGQDAVSSNIAYQDTLAKVAAQVESGTRGLDASTEAGRENLGMLTDLAQDAQKAAQAQFDLDKNTQGFQAALVSGRQSLIDRARDLGATAEEAEALADKIFSIPAETDWKVIAETAMATNQLESLIRHYNGRTITIPVAAGQVVVDGKVYGGLQHRYAEGGAVYGPGTGTSDSIHAMVSNSDGPESVIYGSASRLSVTLRSFDQKATTP
ncbi:phage tail tape measure protein [Microbacterium sp. NPDC055357]